VLDEVNQSSGEARDLISLPVRVEDGGDGQLSATEYLYFLGQSPHAWSFDSTANRWLRPNHPYADQQTYFVTTTEGGSRIQTLSPPSGPVKQAIRFQHVAWGESDLVNLVGSGRAWFGEVLDYTLSRQVDLGLSRLDAQSTARFVVSGAGRSTVFGPKMELRTGQGFCGKFDVSNGLWSQRRHLCPTVYPVLVAGCGWFVVGNGRADAGAKRQSRSQSVDRLHRRSG